MLTLLSQMLSRLFTRKKISSLICTNRAGGVKTSVLAVEKGGGGGVNDV